MQHRQSLIMISIGSRSQGSRDDFNRHIHFAVLRVRQCNVHPKSARRILILEQGAQLRRVIGERVRIDLDNGRFIVFVVVTGRHGDIDACGYVGESRTAEGVGAAVGAVHGVERSIRSHGGRVGG